MSKEREALKKIEEEEWVSGYSQLSRQDILTKLQTLTK
jgi:hypothetical protein